MKRIQLFILLLLIPLFINAQSKLRQADQAFNSQQYFIALQLYKGAYAERTKSKADIPRNFFQQAECYRMISQWQMAKIYYDKAIRANYPDDHARLYLAQMHQMAGEYQDAISDFEIYHKLVPSDPAADIGIQACQNALNWLNDTNRWRVQNESQLNTKSNDFCPTFSNRKHNALIFSSKRPGQTGGKIDPISGGLYSDLFESMVDNKGQWSTPSAVSGDVNMPFSNDGASCITKNGNHIFFTKCGQKKKKFVTCKIYYAEKQGTKWGTPTLVDFGLDAATLDSFNFRHPAVSVNEDVMVFSSDMSGTTGGNHSDLWISTFDKKTHTWGKPVNMGPKINTVEREGFPYIAEDGTLYFSSDGKGGMGGLDIYRAPKTSATSWEWGTPENMKSPINSPADDFGICFDGRQQKGYLTSNREGTKGADDIWRFFWEPICICIDGVVGDCANDVKVKNALVELDGNDGSKASVFTDAEGKYKFKLKENVSYVLNVFGDSASSVKAQSYFSLPENEKGKMTTVGLSDSKNFTYDFCIPPIVPDDIKFPAVLYDVDKATLRPESKDSLNYLYQILIDNPNLVIELDAHTDSRGSADHNRDLAQRRAQSCVDYLISKGIAKERLVAKGFGEDKPLLWHGIVLTEKYISSRPKKEQEALNQLNRRTTFRVLRSNYVDPKAPARGPVAPINVKKGEFDESGVEVSDDSDVDEIQQKSTPKTPAPRQN
jgi:peptidoglycan-associated lipoprotein